MKMKKIIIIAAIITFIVSLAFYLSSPSNKDEELPDVEYQIEDCEEIPELGVIEGSGDTVVYKENKMVFKNNKLFSEINYCSFSRINRDLDYLIDSLHFDEDKVTEDFFDLVTKEKVKFLNFDSTKYNPKLLMDFLVFGERAQIYSQFESKNAFFFRAMSRFYLNTVANTLSNLSFINPDLKHDDQFRLLVSRSKQNKYNVDVKVTSSEKVAYYLKKGKYSYIFNRFWIGTRWYHKFFMFLFLGILCYSFFLFFQKMYNLIKKQNEK